MNDKSIDTSYVMFGQSGLFGDYIDIIHACGGRLTKVIVNVPDPAQPNRKTFADRLAEMKGYVRGMDEDYVIDVDELEYFRPAVDEHYVIGFGGAHIAGLRDTLVRDHSIRFDPLVHPRAEISPTAILGEGVFINAGSVIASWVDVGDFCQINRGATIGHDCRLSEFVKIRPGANLAANVTVGRGATVGIGATVVEDLTIGDGAYVAGGAVVIRDVRPYTVVAGVPAEIIKQRDDHQP